MTSWVIIARRGGVFGWLQPYKIYFFNTFLSDADLERLYEQWEEDDEPLPVDELPDHDPRYGTSVQKGDIFFRLKTTLQKASTCGRLLQV